MDPFTSPKWLNNLLPVIIISAAFALDLVSAIPHPRPLRALWSWISAPYSNFLTLDDLILEPVDRTPQFSQLKTRILAGLSCLAFVGWVGCLMYSVYMNDQDCLIRSLVYSVSWVSCYYISLRHSKSKDPKCYIALAITLRPPLTPPYLFIVFSVISTLLSLVALGNDIFQEENQNAILDVIAMIIPFAFAWIAGTLPLKTYRPSFHVAGANDVCPRSSLPRHLLILFLSTY